FFFSSRRRHTRFKCDWSSDVCSSDLKVQALFQLFHLLQAVYVSVCECVCVCVRARSCVCLCVCVCVCVCECDLLETKVISLSLLSFFLFPLLSLSQSFAVFLCNWLLLSHWLVLKDVTHS